MNDDITNCLKGLAVRCQELNQNNTASILHCLVGARLSNLDRQVAAHVAPFSAIAREYCDLMAKLHKQE